MEGVSTHLGKVLYKYGNKYICELGVGDKKSSILWEEINELFLEGQRASINYIPAGESVSINVVSITGELISLKQSALFRMGSEKASTIFGIYNYIVEKIIDRQMSELVTAIEKGKRISFKSFDVTSTAVYRKKFLGGYDTIAFKRITGCGFNAGEFVIRFIDDKGRLKQQGSGSVRNIPNIHLAQALLLSVAKGNLAAIEKLSHR